jgi:hypothetical protein
MQLNLATSADFLAVMTALQQFIDNSDPDECVEELDAATLEQRAAAMRLLTTLEAKLVSVAA